MSTLFFDLDGTLWDASGSTSRAWTEVLSSRRKGLTVSSRQIQDVAGRPYLECLAAIYPEAFDLPDLEGLLEELARAERHWMLAASGELYPGVREGLNALSEANTLFLVSNCADWYLESFLEASRTRDFFADATCFGLTGLPKRDNLLALKRKHGVDAGFYIGDTAGDRDAAAAAGLTYVHMTYGFGGKDLGARHRFASFGALTDHFLAVT